ncbi:hypothetical protein VNO77_18932 [Canavalia gladiata]|uniref:Rad21/Rec8-like protein N-terminal domain-containing protein n=1 Tax=Canavalia gladiata TaxID=3824 RepID=A0AAN9LLU0_CANGL
MLNTNNKKFLGSSRRRSPLWVAAFCFRNLKKAQVGELATEGAVLDGVSCKIADVTLLAKKMEYSGCYKMARQIIFLVIRHMGNQDRPSVILLFVSSGPYYFGKTKSVGEACGIQANVMLLFLHFLPSADKILQDEMDVESYRVLAYLLLGVVRIYSKKVEYLFHDCNEVLIKINKFVINTKNYAHVENMRMSVTIPDRFELDAFDLDILEDAGGGHIAPQEEITLKEVLGKTEGFGQFSQEKFEEFNVDENTCSSDHLTVGGVCPWQLMNMDFEVFPPNDPINLLESRDIFQSSIFSHKEPMNFDTVLVVKGVEKESVNLFVQDQQVNEDQTVQEIVPCEEEIHEERSRTSHEESMDISMFSGREKEPVLSVEAFCESHQVDNEQIMAKETLNSFHQMNLEIIEVHEARSFQESIERPLDEKFYGKECMHHRSSSVSNEILEELIEGSVEKHDNKGKLEFQEKVSLEGEKFSSILPELKNLDATPQSKFQGGSVGRPKPGATTPEFILISTPAVRERARFSKRKSILDEMVVLPNEFKSFNGYLPWFLVHKSGAKGQCHVPRI